MNHVWIEARLTGWDVVILAVFWTALVVVEGFVSEVVRSFNRQQRQDRAEARNAAVREQAKEQR